MTPLSLSAAAQEHYNTVYGDTFQDPKNTLGFGAKTKAEKLKKAVSCGVDASHPG